MRFIKLGLISFVVIFIILTAIASLLPSSILVSRAVDIKGSIDNAKQQVFDLNNWQNWMTDAKGQKGEYAYANNSLSIGSARVMIANSSDTTFRTTWSASNTMVGTFRFIDHHRADSLFTVQWQMEQKVKWYPWEKFASITKDEIWGASMEKSLDNLKNLIEVK